MHVLTNGVELPDVGVGTFELTKRLSAPDAENLLVEFLSSRADELSLIDTAPVYDTEELIGRAVQRAIKNGVPREKIVLETKISNDMQGFDNALQEFGRSLEKLQADFVDVLLIHWPIPRGHEGDWRELNLSTWQAMEELYREGKVRAIGVSNFLPLHLQNIIDNAEIPPMVNQLEIHPWYHERETVEFCQANGIVVEAWSPFKRAAIFRSDDINRLASAHGIAPEKFVLAWLKSRGIIPIPKSSSLERMLGNLQVPSIEFRAEDLKVLADLDSETGHEDFWNYKRQLNSVSEGDSAMNNLFDIKGKTVLITGASSGIGASAASLFASQTQGGGIKIAICARRDGKLQALAQNLTNQYGAEILPIKCDVSVESDVVRAVETAVDRFGRIDILLNCAGITAKSTDITDHTLEQWNNVIGTNITGTYLMCREVAKHMKKHLYGKIINIASITAMLGFNNQISYASSKGAVVSFTRSLAVELGKYNITVNAIVPGLIATEMVNQNGRGYRYFKSRTVNNSVGETEDLHGAIMLLASDASRFMTGSLITVDGGHTINL